MSKADIRLDGDLLRVNGELTFATVTALLAKSRPLFDQASKQITVELGEVERADSAGLAILIEWMRQAKERGATIAFSHLPDQMLAIATASELDTLLPQSS